MLLLGSQFQGYPLHLNKILSVLTFEFHTFSDVPKEVTTMIDVPFATVVGKNPTTVLSLF